jgi:hypothetical protein
MGAAASAGDTVNKKQQSDNVENFEINDQTANLSENVQIVKIEEESENKNKYAPSNNKLKRMALGQQGYKDVHRDYDEVLQTIDMNKTSQLDWPTPAVNFAAPKNIAKSKKNDVIQDHKDLKETDNKASYPRKVILNQQANRNINSPYSSVVQNHNAESMLSPQTPLNGRRKHTTGDPYLAMTKKLNNIESSNNSSLSEFHTEETSQKLGLNKNNVVLKNDAKMLTPLKTATPVNAAGQRLISRPFNQKSTIEDNDDTYAEFFDKNQTVSNSKKPNNVPILPLTIGTSPLVAAKQGSAASAIVGTHLFFGNEYELQQTSSFTLPPTTNMTLKNKIIPAISTAQQQSSIATMNNTYNNNITTGNLNNNNNNNSNKFPSPYSNFNNKSVMSTNFNNNNNFSNIDNNYISSISTATSPYPTKPRPQLAPPINNLNNTAASQPPARVIPQVKETKDVKRNRAQIPEQLTHAKPTTGDWLKKRYIVNNYILLETLGTGSYGEV